MGYYTANTMRATYATLAACTVARRFTDVILGVSRVREVGRRDHSHLVGG